MLDVGSHEDQRELVAPDAADRVGGSQVRLEALGEGPQRGVAGGVTVLVVDGLEPVEVVEHQRQRGAGPPGPGQLSSSKRAKKARRFSAPVRSSTRACACRPRRRGPSRWSAGPAPARPRRWPARRRSSATSGAVAPLHPPPAARGVASATAASRPSSSARSVRSSSASTAAHGTSGNGHRQLKRSRTARAIEVGLQVRERGATVDHQLLAGNVGGGVGAEEADDRRDVLRGADAGQRRALLGDRGELGVVGDDRREGGGDHPGRHAVGAHGRRAYSRATVWVRFTTAAFARAVEPLALQMEAWR